MPKSKPVYESMTRLRVGRFTVRIWRSEKTLKEACSPDTWNINSIARTTRRTDECLSIEAIVAAFINMNCVAAVEVLDKNKNGVVVYNDWP